MRHHIDSCKSEPDEQISETFSFMLSITLSNPSRVNFHLPSLETHSTIILLSTFSIVATALIFRPAPFYFAFLSNIASVITLLKQRNNCAEEKSITSASRSVDTSHQSWQPIQKQRNKKSPNEGSGLSFHMTKKLNDTRQLKYVVWQTGI